MFPGPSSPEPRVRSSRSPPRLPPSLWTRVLGPGASDGLVPVAAAPLRGPRALLRQPGAHVLLPGAREAPGAPAAARRHAGRPGTEIWGHGECVCALGGQDGHPLQAGPTTPGVPPRPTHSQAGPRAGTQEAGCWGHPARQLLPWGPTTCMCHVMQHVMSCDTGVPPFLQTLMGRWSCVSLNVRMPGCWGHQHASPFLGGPRHACAISCDTRAPSFTDPDGEVALC